LCPLPGITVVICLNSSSNAMQLHHQCDPFKIA
jgi:hypothetical protein